MLSFVKWLMEEIEKVTEEEMAVVDAKLNATEEGETVIVEEMNVLYKKLFTFLMNTHLRAINTNEIINDVIAEILKEVLIENSKEYLAEEIIRYEEHLVIISGIFWESIKMDIPEANKLDSLCVRKGWKIVSLPSPSFEESRSQKIRDEQTPDELCCRLWR